MWNIQLGLNLKKGKRVKKKLVDSEKEIYENIRKFQLKKKAEQLKNRTKSACQDNTNYEVMLRDFCTHNQNNLLLLTRVVGYRKYLLNNGCTEREAAKEVLLQYKH